MAAIMAVCIALVSLIPAFGQWLYPHSSTNSSPPLPQTAPSIMSSTVPPTSRSLEPRLYDFSSCIDICNGSNSINSFFQKPLNINVMWKYENIPLGAQHIITWSVEKKGTWITFSCNWTGPSSGTVESNIHDVNGLPSGSWTITIFVNDKALLQNSFFIQGHFNNWDPQGTIAACY